MDFRIWAFWRRVQYGFIYLTIIFSLIMVVYYLYFYKAPTCFDGIRNNQEEGIDCGGGCLPICSFKVIPPVVTWAESFKIVEGQYNAVAYIENQNELAATEKLKYTFKFYDANNNLITERKGVTVLPPNSTYPIFEGRINTDLAVIKRTEIELEPVNLWLPATIGRNQFRSTDIKLSGADDKPRLDVIMENTTLYEAENIVVVATIFNSVGTPLTASETLIDRFAGESRKNIVFTWPQPISKTVRSCEVPTDIVMAIDLSGSMNNDGGNPPQPITNVLEAASTFISNARSKDQVALVTFATEAKNALYLDTDLSRVEKAVKELKIDPKEETGSTNMGDALLEAQKELNSVRHNTDARNVVVLLTDGLPTEPDPDPTGYVLDAAEKIKNDNIIIYTIGLGSEVDADLLKRLASVEENSFIAANTLELKEIYERITTAICEDGASRIDIIPKTDTNFPQYP
ncbi:VWA domain-containing protein [Candidatus Kaiserbacteria bacterium]|nr:VWA domain-containing protein [Candidatus Kaiserbacteria bacterium]